MQQMKPCARCEQELPEAFFDSTDSMFCKRCADEVNRLLRKKYGIIQAAHFRAKLRHNSKLLKQRMRGHTASTSG